MSLTPEQHRNLNDRIGWLLDKHLAPLFKPGAQLSFIARTPGNDEADVLVTSERDLNDLMALVLRSLGRAVVGEGVDTVPRTSGVLEAHSCDNCKGDDPSKCAYNLAAYGVGGSHE